MARENKIIIEVGNRGTGKTPEIQNGVLKKYPVDKKVLVLDCISHPAYEKYRQISISDLIRYPEMKGRFKIIGDRTELKQVMDICAQKLDDHLPRFRNGIIVCEDAYRYFDLRIPDSVIDFMISSKQVNVDMVFMYHAWMVIPKNILRYGNILTIFKCGESPAERKESLGGKFNEIMIAYEQVMAATTDNYGNGGKSFCLSIEYQ